MNAPDISNIESKPTVVLVSNQSEFDQLMQHLEKEGCVWNGYGAEKPTEWSPSGFLPPYIINIRPDKKITWGLESKETAIPFPEYAAKYIKPKRPYPNRVVESKYDAVVFDLKMAQAALDNRNKEINGWVEQNNELRAERDRLEREIKEVADIGLKWKTEADQLTAELRRKCDALEAERDKYKESAEINGKAAHDMLRDYEKVLLDIGKVTAERDRLREAMELHKQSSMRKSLEVDQKKAAADRLRNDNNEQGKLVDYLKEELRKSDQLIESKAAEHANLDTLARNLRDQRDTARFLAALFFLASAGFAVAVLIGRLIPVY